MWSLNIYLVSAWTSELKKEMKIKKINTQQ